MEIIRELDYMGNMIEPSNIKEPVKLYEYCMKTPGELIN